MCNRPACHSVLWGRCPGVGQVASAQPPVRSRCMPVLGSRCPVQKLAGRVGQWSMWLCEGAAAQTGPGAGACVPSSDAVVCSATRVIQRNTGAAKAVAAPLLSVVRGVVTSLVAAAASGAAAATEWHTAQLICVALASACHTLVTKQHRTASQRLGSGTSRTLPSLAPILQCC